MGATDVTVRLIQRSSNPDEPRLGRATQITVKEFSDSAWVGHPDPSVDVAVMSLSVVLQAMTSRGEPPFYRSVAPEFCLGVGAAIETDAIEEVTFIGYPNGLYDTVNYLPIARRGSTATPIEVDYQGAPAFLIDASVFPGSSGSPVFILDRGMYTDRMGNTTLGNRMACVGVLAAVHTRSVEGAVANVATRLVASFDEPIDLGIVYKSICFDECVQIMLDKAGLDRMPSRSLLRKGQEVSSADETVEEAN